MISGMNFLDLFAPPKNYKIEFGVATTMTQDTDSLELIMETLVGKSAYELKTLDRSIKLALIYDNTSPIVETHKLGGIYPIRVVDNERLLHAKMALLKFVKKKETLYRLIIFTGNFTNASLQQQIEMVWSHDYSFDDLYINDLHEASQFLRNLLQSHCHDSGPLSGKINQLFEEISSLNEGKEKSRFIHSLNNSLFDQSIEQFKRYQKGNRGKHNYITFGSPFLQENIAEDSFLISDFVYKLKESKTLINRNDYLHLQTTRFNLSEALEKACQKKNIKVYTTEGTNRTLHSKYIQLARFDNKTLYSNVFYIGSGNLTINGFKKAQNIECGIVFEQSGHIKISDCDEMLYFSDEIESSHFSSDVTVPKEDEAKQEFFNLSVLSASLKENKLKIFFAPKEDFVPLRLTSNGVELATIDTYPGESLNISLSDTTGIYDTIIVEDHYKQRYPILIFLANGLPNKIDIPKRSFDEVFSLLKAFPNMNILDEEEEFNSREIDININNISEEELINHRKSFALYNFTELIEHIARENENVLDNDLEIWANTLKFTLVDTLEDKDKRKMTVLGADKLNILKENGFSPSLESTQLLPYYNAIEQIINDWKAKLD
jgi:hypothetical protein